MSFYQVFGKLLNGYTPSVILATAAVLLVCWSRLSVRVDAREPPILKPTIPYIGHIIGLLTHQTSYFEKLRAKKGPEPISTLPMINAKMYLITSPALAQSAFRNKDLSFEPFELEFAQRVLGLSNEDMAPVRVPGVMGGFHRAVHSALAAEHLHKMNEAMLNEVATHMNRLDGTFEVGSLYLWIWSTLTMATAHMLYGSHNPLKQDPTLVDSLRDFDNGVILLAMAPFPSFFAPKAFRGRAALQAPLVKYYSAGYHLESDVAEITKARANLVESSGVPRTAIGNFEISLLHVSTTNAIPTLFWHLIFVASDSALVSEIREELLSVTTISPSRDGHREMKIDITKFENSCPLFASSYRETIRLVNGQTSTRRVMADTTISDGQNTYLLREGADIQIPAGVSHNDSASWGPNVSSFDARRFMKLDEKKILSEKEKADEKEQRRAYFPFGGGRHLCPGRNFAFAEILGTIAVLLLGFELRTKDGGSIQRQPIGRPRLGTAVTQPSAQTVSMGARLTRRKGWEDAVFKFVTGKE